MSLVGNERTKLTANYLNGVAIAVFAVGGLGSLLAGLNSQDGVTLFTASVIGICFAASMALHWMARLILKGLRE